MEEGTIQVPESIIRESILENKNRTKSYWEHRMMAAGEGTIKSDGVDPIRQRDTTDSSETSDSNSPSTRNSMCSGEVEELYRNDDKEKVGDELNTLEMKKVKDERQRIEREIRLQRERKKAPLSQETNLTSIESKIAVELQEMREREEELKQLRKKLSLINCKVNTEVKETIAIPMTPASNTTVEESFSSIPTTDEGNYSEYGSEEKDHSLDGNNSRVITPDPQTYSYRRTQSLDSVSSGHSSGSDRCDRDSLRRQVIVKPYEESEEEETSYLSNEQETPIEREIRLTKEREEELRREKGLPLYSDKTNKNETRIQIKNTKNAISNDPRSVQHRLATNRIQKEIDEAFEREKELRTEGKILTTSEETLDSKVTRFTELAEFSISEGRHIKKQRMKRSSSTSQLLVAMKAEELSLTSLVHSNKEISDSSNRRYVKNAGQKGIMERFIATRGRLSIQSIISPVPGPMSTAKYNTLSTPQQINLRNETVSGTYSGRSVNKFQKHFPLRRGYTSAEEKIQEELKEMKRREDELRLQRASVFARSQPNLLCIGADEEEEPTSWTSHKGNPERSSLKTNNISLSLSNCNILDIGEDDKVVIKTPRKRNSLIAEWESRIQSANID